MDKDRVSGKAKDIKGRIKRQAGEWTGDENLQAEGAKDQIKGKAEGAFGKAKDVGRKVMDDARREVDDIERERQRKREREVRGKKVA